MNHRSRTTWLVWPACALGLLLAAPPARADIQPLAPDQTAYGMTRGQWLEAFIQWWGSLPDNSSPWRDLDSRGVRAGVAQHGPVWFLPPGDIGTTNISRTITVPEGKAILVGVLFSMSWAVPGAKTDAKHFQDAERSLSSILAQHTRIGARLDGVSMGDVMQYRVQTPVFSINLPPGNWFQHPVVAGKDARLAVATNAIFLLYPPLPVGTHVISHEYEGIGGNGIGQAGKPFKKVETYTLQVQRPNEPLQ